MRRSYRSSDEYAQWLRNEYVDKKRNVREIAAEKGCSKTAILDDLRIHFIPVRSVRESRLIRRISDHFHLGNIDVIRGSLLGDASVTLTKGMIAPHFQKINVGFDHILFVANKIFKINGEDRIYKIVRDEEHPTWQDAYQISSLSYDDLMPMYEEWYPVWNKRKKIVPRSLRFSPEMVLHWFMDDGWSYQDSPTNCSVGLATNGFSFEDHEFLCAQFVSVGIDAYPKRNNDGQGFVTVEQKS